MEDLIEEVMGKIQVDENIYWVKGIIAIEELNDQSGVKYLSLYRESVWFSVFF
ncbi:MAG TPA: hypothetical protein VN370_06240 [Desulfitobacteriaceae bacterium]|nr:hypothetical protein [Desulfitobacteriaceae bacterium]